MKKTILLLLFCLILTSCSDSSSKVKEEMKPVYTEDGFEVPILISEIDIYDVSYYPWRDKQKPNYYGMQVRIRNRSNYTIIGYELTLSGTTPSGEKLLIVAENTYSDINENNICQGDCESPSLIFGGSLYFEGDIEVLKDILTLESFKYSVKTKNSKPQISYIYNYQTDEYISGIML